MLRFTATWQRGSLNSSSYRGSVRVCAACPVPYVFGVRANPCRQSPLPQHAQEARIFSTPRGFPCPIWPSLPRLIQWVPHFCYAPYYLSRISDGVLLFLRLSSILRDACGAGTHKHIARGNQRLLPLDMKHAFAITIPTHNQRSEKPQEQKIKKSKNPKKRKIEKRNSLPKAENLHKQNLEAY
jgi:hypothetical protein